jgi:hypothetical protein
MLVEVLWSRPGEFECEVEGEIEGEIEGELVKVG